MSIPSLLVIHFLALVSPGPDFFIVSSSSLRSRKRGFLTALGVSTAMAIHLIFWGFGFSSYITQFPAIFKILQVFGALYLLYLGLQLIKDCLTKKRVTEECQKASENGFREGFTTNLFNPKVWAYFASLFTQVDLSQQSSFWMAQLVSAFVFLTLLWFFSVVALLSCSQIKSAYSSHVSKVQLVLGAILLMVSLKMLVAPISQPAFAEMPVVQQTRVLVKFSGNP